MTEVQAWTWGTPLKNAPTALEGAAIGNPHQRTSLQRVTFTLTEWQANTAKTSTASTRSDTFGPDGHPRPARVATAPAPCRSGETAHPARPGAGADHRGSG